MPRRDIPSRGIVDLLPSPVNGRVEARRSTAQVAIQVSLRAPGLATEPASAAHRLPLHGW